MKLIMTKGLPGSGKTTWAKEVLLTDSNTVLVCKDDLRAMMFNSAWSGKREKFILQTRDYIVSNALSQGKNVIVHDTNFAPKHEERLRQLARENKAQFEIKDFTSVSLEQCIHNDLCREDSVGEKVIRDMYRDFIQPPPAIIDYNPNLPNAVICDLDGTLALFGDRNPYERDFENDSLNEPVAHILRTVHQTGLGAKIIFVSGRKSKFRKQTEEFLKKNDFSEIIYEALYMPRADADNRNDVIIKREVYEQHIKGKYNILFVLDDRLRVCRLWHALGLSILRVGDPDADF